MFFFLLDPRSSVGNWHCDLEITLVLRTVTSQIYHQEYAMHTWFVAFRYPYRIVNRKIPVYNSLSGLVLLADVREHHCSL